MDDFSVEDYAKDMLEEITYSYLLNGVLPDAFFQRLELRLEDNIEYWEERVLNINHRDAIVSGYAFLDRVIMLKENYQRWISEAKYRERFHNFYSTDTYVHDDPAIIRLVRDSSYRNKDDVILE